MSGGDGRELCGKCFERFEPLIYQPVALDCGHSFCRPCLIDLNSNSDGELKCPKCSRCHKGDSPEILPVNFLLLDLIERITGKKNKPRTARERKDDDDADIKKKCCDDSDSSSDSDEEDCKKTKNTDKKEDAKKKDKKDETTIPILSKEEDKKDEPDNEDRSNLIADNKGNPQKKALSKKVIFLILVIVSAIIGTVGMFIPQLVIQGWGFTETGIEKGSTAADMMSEATKDGKHIKDTNIPFLQGAGTKGFSSSYKTAFWFGGFFSAFFVGIIIITIYFCVKKCKKEYIMYKDLLSQQRDFQKTEDTGL